MCIFLDILHVIPLKIISINMPHCVMISPHSAGISQSRIKIYGVAVKARSDHLIYPIGKVDNIYVNIITHLDLFFSTS